MTKRFSVAAVGDVSSKSTFSGTPYHFWATAKSMGYDIEPWRMNLSGLDLRRKLWNIGRMAMMQRPGGFQYSRSFGVAAMKQIDPEVLKTNVISFNQHFPSAHPILKSGGKLNLYIDATFTQLLDRYKVREMLGSAIVKQTLKEEKETFQLANKIFTMQQWAKNSVVDDYGISSDKVIAVLPGANIMFPLNYEAKPAHTGMFGKERPLILGFVGKDWKRKGLGTLLQIRDNLEQRGHHVLIRCAGFAPPELTNRKGIDFAGFIDKNNDYQKFINFLESCDIGCLYSEAEFSSISILEFISVGRPVAGFVVDGMNDLFIEGLSLRSTPDDSVDRMADRFERFILEEQFRNSLITAAIKHSRFVRWERSVMDVMKHINQ